MRKQTLYQKTVWITGASRGIGLELALLSAGEGANLGLLSSRKKVLDEAAELCAARGAKVHVIAVDLGDAAAAVAAAERLLTETGVPDILILNAGLSQRSRAAETGLSVTRRILDVNFFGAVAVIRTVLPAVLEAGGLRIGVTSSLVGVHGFPLRSAYSASKHALHGYFESLWLEYRDRGIHVTTAIPGRIRTNISMRALTGNGGEHGRMDPGQKRGMDVRKCAKRYLRALLQGRREVVIGGFETVSVFLRRYFPSLFFALIRKIKAV